jgi:hypothetical protein
MTTLTKYLAGVLTVIAVSMSVIAYHLTFPRVSPMDVRGGVDGWSRTMLVNASRDVSDPSYAAGRYLGSFTGDRFVTSDGSSVDDNRLRPSAPARTIPVRRTIEADPVARRTVTREPRRDWKKTALMIGGSTAAGAGVGGIFGGTKGALIGAAIGGGAGTLYETTK